MNDLQQFVGARVLSLAANDDESVALTLQLADGSERDLAIYSPFHETIAVRIDGMFVPPEEL